VIFRKALALSIILFFSVLSAVTAADETKDRFVRLLINEKTGSFSLFYLTDVEDMRYRPLFNHRNPSATFMDVNINGAAYRLGKTKAFTTRMERYNEDPVVIYESSFAEISQMFTPIRTLNSPNANGIKITITLRNKSENEITAGLRFLLDTSLSEGQKNIPFVTDNINITGETLVESSAEENYWLTRGKYVTLMGSIKNPEGESPSVKAPDFLHFANWKRLSDVPWKAPYHEGRTFNLMPYSINDSAVCYYYEPDTLLRGEAFTYTVFLTTEDTSWYLPDSLRESIKEEEAATVAAAAPASSEAPKNLTAETTVRSESLQTEPSSRGNAPAMVDYSSVKNEVESSSRENSENQDLAMIKEMQNILNQFIAGEIYLNEQDLVEIEASLNKYGLK
jgi:hypothetical protein